MFSSFSEESRIVLRQDCRVIVLKLRFLFSYLSLLLLLILLLSIAFVFAILFFFIGVATFLRYLVKGLRCGKKHGCRLVGLLLLVDGIAEGILLLDVMGGHDTVERVGRFDVQLRSAPVSGTH